MALCSDVEVEVSPLIGSDWLAVIVVVFFRLLHWAKVDNQRPYINYTQFVNSPCKLENYENH